MRKILRKLARAAIWHYFLDKSQHEGIPVRVIFSADEIVRRSAVEALDLIREVDPRTFRLITRLLAGGVAIARSYRDLGYYDRDRKACFLSLHHATEHAIEEVALTIVHETCHARLEQRGIDYDDDLRFRVEQVCTRRELAFARRLVRHNPEGVDYATRSQERLAALSRDALTDEGFRQKARLNRLLELRQLKSFKAPKLLRRCAVMKVRRERQRAARPNH